MELFHNLILNTGYLWQTSKWQLIISTVILLIFFWGTYVMGKKAVLWVIEIHKVTWKDIKELNKTGVVNLLWPTRLVLLFWGFIITLILAPILFMLADFVFRNIFNLLSLDSWTTDFFQPLRLTFFFGVLFSLPLWFMRTADKKKEFNDELQVSIATNISNALENLTNDEMGVKFVGLLALHNLRNKNFIFDPEYDLHLSAGFNKLPLPNGNKDTNRSEVTGSEIFETPLDINLFAIRLAGVKLPLIDFQRADLKRCEVWGSILLECIFGRELISAKFYGSEIRKSIFNNTSFHYCEFHNTELFDCVYLYDESVEISSNIQHGVQFEKVKLFLSDFSKIKFINAKIKNLNMFARGLTLNDTEFQKVCFDKSIFIHTDFERSIFHKVTFQEVTFCAVNFGNAVFKGVDFTGTIVDNYANDNKKYSWASSVMTTVSYTKGTIDFRGADLKDTNINKITINDGCEIFYDENTKLPPGFIETQPKGWTMK